MFMHLEEGKISEISPLGSIVAISSRRRNDLELIAMPEMHPISGNPDKIGYMRRPSQISEHIL
jgi:hypothetical protein